MLISSVDQFRAHVDVSYDFKWQRIAMSLQQAELEYMLPVLGAEFLAELNAYAAAPTNNAVLDDVLLHAQRAHAIMGYYLAVPNLQLKQSDSGLHVLANEEKKSPYQWQVGDYRESFLQGGYAAIEKLYGVLMDNAAALATWRTSDGYAQFNDSLLRTAEEFHRQYRIGISRITFVDLRPAIDRAQDLILRPTLGEAFYDSLIHYVREGDDDSDSATDADSILLDKAVKKLRKALAHFAIGEAKEVNFRLVNGGLLSSRFEGNSTNSVKIIDERLNAELTATTRSNATKKGYELLSLAQSWLDANADSFPLYRNGPGYRPTGAAERPMESRIHNRGGILHL